MSSVAPFEITSDATPETVLQWAYETFSRVVIAANV